MTSQLRFGVIGCGEDSATWLAGISAAHNAGVAMLADERQTMLDDLAEMYAVPTTTRAEDVLASRDVDAVYLGGNTADRAGLIVDAAKAGKHVLAANPFAHSLDAADAAIAACRAAGVLLGVALDAQVDAAASAVRELLRAGLLGDLIGARVNILSGEGASTLADELNRLIYVVGGQVVRAYAEAVGAEGITALSGVIGFANGLGATVQRISPAVGGNHHDLPGIRVYGTRGQVIVSREPLICMSEPSEGGVPDEWRPLRYHGPRGDAARVVDAFAEAVLAGEDVPTGATEGRRIVHLLAALERSSERNAVIHLEA